MADIERISPQQALRHIAEKAALLVCAYDSEEKFQQNRLLGAVSLSEFHSRVPGLSRDQEIIFYCA